MSMTDVVCPDCGKYIAPIGAVEAHLRCHCADEQDRASAPSVPPPQKRCYVCSTDLSNRKRLKDHLGRYWCDECAKADKRAKKRAAENQCPDCSRLFPPDKLFEQGTDRVCKHCHKKRLDEISRKLVHLGHAAASRRYEWKHIKWMLIVLAVLLVLATYHQFLR